MNRGVPGVFILFQLPEPFSCAGYAVKTPAELLSALGTFTQATACEGRPAALSIEEHLGAAKMDGGRWHESMCPAVARGTESAQQALLVAVAGVHAFRLARENPCPHLLEPRV